MGEIRTDLAMESGALAHGGHIDGVETRESQLAGWPVTEVSVRSEEGARELGKPQGQYFTIHLTDYRAAGADAFPRAVDAVCACLTKLLPNLSGEAMVVGLGNRAVTPDAIGPRTADHVLVTRHLTRHDPEHFGSFFPVAALAAGVLGTTGVESGELVRAVCQRIKPAFLLVVDALAARSMGRLCTTVQITDTGITPGSGVGNARTALNQETLGVPVIALGVPTVVDGETLARDFGGQATEEFGSVLVTPKDVDTQVTELSKIVGYGINARLQEGMSVEDMDYFLG